MTSTPTEATAVRNVLVSSISPEVWPAHDSCNFTNALQSRWKTEDYLMWHEQDVRIVAKRERRRCAHFSTAARKTCQRHCLIHLMCGEY